MCNCPKLLINVLILAIGTSLPCMAQERATKPGEIVCNDSVTLASLDTISLPDGLRDRDAPIRDFDFGGQFRMRYHHENNHYNFNLVDFCKKFKVPFVNSLNPSK